MKKRTTLIALSIVAMTFLPECLYARDAASSTPGMTMVIEFIIFILIELCLLYIVPFFVSFLLRRLGRSKEVMSLKEQVKTTTNDLSIKAGEMEKLTKINTSLSDTITAICGRLGLEPDSSREAIIKKIEALDALATENVQGGVCAPTEEAPSSPCEVKPEQRTAIEDAYAQALIERLQKSDDKVIKAAISDAIKKRQDGCKEVIEKFLQILPSKMRNSTDPASVQSTRITDNQLNQPENRRILIGWVINQLSVLNDYKGFDDRKNISKDALFKEIVGKLRQADAAQEAAEGDGQAKEADKLTEEQKKTVLQEIIDEINRPLPPDQTLGNDGIGQFIDDLGKLLPRPADISEAEATERKKNLELINKVLKSSLQDLDEKSVKDARDAWLLGKMNEKIDGLQADNLGRLYEILRDAIKRRDELKALLASYGATTKEELEKKIREKDYAGLRKSVNDKLQTLIPNKRVETAEQLVRALIKVAEEGQQDIQLIVEELKEKVADYTDAPATKSTATELVDEYSRCVQQKEKELRDDIDSKEQTINDNNKVISEREATIAKNKAEIEKKSERINALLSDSTTMVDTLRSFAQQLGSLQSPLLDPCSNRDEGACAHANTTLTDAISTFTQRLTTFSVAPGTSPRDTKQQIREMLTSFLTDPSSAVSILCRYYAYSNLPFMSDSQRKYGVLINVSAAHEQYTLIARLYATFSITLIVPALFAHGVATTPYIALSGKASSALSFLCPQVVNHKDTMDTSVKPRDVVYDIVRVGYAIDDKIQAQPEVITF